MDFNGLGNLYDNLLFNPLVMSGISCGKITESGGSKEMFWGEADDAIFYYVQMQYLNGVLPGSSGAEAGRALVLADYVAYVPYGEQGYEALDKIVKKMGYSGVEEWRYKKFVAELRDRAANVSASTLNAVKAYFSNFKVSVLHSDDIFEITAGLCRLSHVREACYNTPKWRKAESLSPVEVIMDAIEGKKKVSFAKVAAAYPKVGALGAEQMEYLGKVARFEA